MKSVRRARAAPNGLPRQRVGGRFTRTYMLKKSGARRRFLSLLTAEGLLVDHCRLPVMTTAWPLKPTVSQPTNLSSTATHHLAGGRGPARDPGAIFVGTSHLPRGGGVLGQAGVFSGPRSSDEGTGPGHPFLREVAGELHCAWKERLEMGD
jgi:hypothetical protein